VVRADGAPPVGRGIRAEPAFWSRALLPTRTPNAALVAGNFTAGQPVCRPRALLHGCGWAYSLVSHGAVAAFRSEKQKCARRAETDIAHHMRRKVISYEASENAGVRFVSKYAATNAEVLPGDPARFVAREENNSIRNFLWRTDAIIR